MTLADEVRNEAPIAVAKTPGHLSVIRSLDCTTAVRPRQRLYSFQSWIGGMAPERLPTAQVILRPEDGRSHYEKI